MSFPTRYDDRSKQPVARSVPVTVITLTKNEAPNIARCLASTTWAAQQIVIDSGSSDQTVAIAHRSNAQVIETHWRGFGRQRQWALSRPEIQSEWILFVDADEWISEELALEISSAIQTSKYNAYGIQFRLVFLGRWIAHCGWYPSAEKTVLVNKNRVRYDNVGFAEHPIVEGMTGSIRAELVDEDLKPFTAWLHKHVDYAPLEAERQLNRSSMRVSGSSFDKFIKKTIAPRIPFRPLIQFLYMYIARRGFLDGREGFIFCFMHAWFQTVVSVQKRELQKLDSRPSQPR